MRIITAILFLITYSAFGQYDDISTTGFEVEQLTFKRLDSSTIKTFSFQHTNYKNVLSYETTALEYDSDQGIRLAYDIGHQDDWISISLPFTELPSKVELINIDGKGKPELVIRGKQKVFGSGGENGTIWLMIVNIDSIPTRIFHISYGCYEEAYRRPPKVVGYYHHYEREIEVSKEGIVIAPSKKRIPRFSECHLTKVEAGVYTMKDGQIEKKKE